MLDASVALAASYRRDGFAHFRGERLIAPPLMWSHAPSALHELLWRREIDEEDAEATRRRIEECPVQRARDTRLGDEAWRLANELGWAKTYDAEYVALPRLRRGAARAVNVLGPTELAGR